MTKKLNKNKGVTIVALVITIIVLLILAGVTIAMLSGENGILTKAKEAKTRTDNASTLEKLELTILAAKDNTGTFNMNIFKEE